MVEMIVRGRQNGKSLELIKRAEKTNSYIIVLSRRDALNLMKLAEESGHKILFPVTIDEYQQNRFRGSHVRHILIDDADRILQYLFREVEIDAITMTDESEVTDDAKEKTY